MVDPSDPLAHLYADALVDDEGTGELEEDLPRRKVLLEQLLEHEAHDDEILSDADVDELATLIMQRPELRADEQAVELGLGSVVDGELELNLTGRRVLARIVERQAAQ
jgi:hypothetical protein